jgi:protein-S-isoprenylcysteine O-methyltransferase Ste14
MNIWNGIIRQTKKEYSKQSRITAVAIESIVFIFAIPGLLVYLSLLENGRLSIVEHPVFLVIGGITALCGISFALWTVWAQVYKARGTPVPVMATKKLLTDKPYCFCRNPMAFGTILFYAGISIIVRSYLSIGTTIVFMLLLIVIIKTFEEKELSLRFGEDYLQYKKDTPFLIPRVSRLKKRKMSDNKPTDKIID